MQKQMISEELLLVGDPCGSAYSWRTPPHSMNPYWSSSWWTATWGSSQWITSQRTAYHGREPMLEEGKRVRRKEQKQQSIMDWPQPISSGQNEGGGRRRWMEGRRWFLFPLTSHCSSLLSTDNKLIYPDCSACDCNQWVISLSLSQSPSFFFPIIYSPQKKIHKICFITAFISQSTLHFFNTSFQVFFLWKSISAGWKLQCITWVGKNKDLGIIKLKFNTLSSNWAQNWWTPFLKQISYLSVCL